MLVAEITCITQELEMGCQPVSTCEVTITQYLFKVLWAVLVGFVLRHGGLEPEVRAIILQILVRRQPIFQSHTCQRVNRLGTVWQSKIQGHKVLRLRQQERQQ